MIKKFLLLFVFLFSLTYAYSQDRTISGKVVDETGATLPGATVVLKGTQKATVTDVDGNYKISVPSAGGVLVVTYVGYTAQEIQIGTDDVINVNMAPEVQSLDQVVVVGYGVQKKSLVTGSISKVESKDITSMPVTRIEQALQGKTSGVYVAQSSGTPGGAMSIKIRGNSSEGKNNPIYIVDGIKTNTIDFISPNDIESMEILKDAASCAIYGAEGGNGVVIVTTKKGKAGSSIIEYKYQHGWQNVANHIDMMNAQQYRKYQQEAVKWEKDKKWGRIVDAMDSTTYTNWLDQIFQQAPMDEHNVTFASGTEKGTFFLSASYLTQDGIIGGPNNNFTRYTFRMNGDSKLNKWLSTGGSVAYTQSKKYNLTDNSDFFGGVITSAMYFDPTSPIYYKQDSSDIPGSYLTNPEIMSALVKDSKGIYHNSKLTTGDVANPLAMIYNNHNTTQINKVLADVHGEIRFFDWLKLTSKLGLDFSLDNNNVFTPKYYYDDTNKQTNDTIVSIESAYNKYYKYSFENYLSFERSFGDHAFTAMLGISYERSSPTFLYVRGMHVPYGAEQFAYIHNSRNYSNHPANIDGGIGSFTRSDFYSTDPPFNNYYDDSEIQNSYFGRISYNYKEKYLLQGNFRRDGSSLFGPKNRYAFFPSFSVGWNISKESFFADNISFMNTFKVRFSWGQNGNKQILKAFGYTSLMTVNGVYAVPGGTFAYGAFPSRPGNDNYKWETSQQTDFGIEGGIFKNRIVFSFDYFDKRTKDQLGEQASVYDLMGYTARPYENNGEVKNNGYEFDVTYRESDKQFKYSVNFNASRLYNKVLKYGTGVSFKDGYKMNTGAIVTRYEAGYPVYYFRGYKAIGIFQDTIEINNYGNIDPVTGQFTKFQKFAVPGDVKFADVASTDASGKVVMKPDGVIDESDRVMIGDPNPDWIFGFNFNCEFKGVDFGVFFQGVTGNELFFSALRNDRGSYNKPVFYYEGRWTGPGTSNKYPRATYTDKNGNFTASTLNISDGSYLRLKNISLGYTLPKSLTSKVGISKLRIFGNATNLLTFTKYKGTDPEIGQMDYTTNNSYGIDRGLYPSAKTYTVGVNVNF